MLLFVLWAFVSACFAVTGVDVSQAVSESAWKCLHGSKSFAVVRGYQSVGRVDPNAEANVRNAKAAGIPYVDVYLFPCVHCGDPAGQVRALHASVSGYGMMWLDIEILSWGSEANNRVFISEMIKEGKALGIKLGIYTNENNWSNIVGVNWAGAADLPLWYAHYDGNPSFSDFKPFGGWTKPSIKQYHGSATECGVGVDLNWYP
uniref:Lysozyme n=1 Tax=Arcella intermedia TaxID=1963864 RepID=A0A6B2LIR1_9EUKA